MHRYRFGNDGINIHFFLLSEIRRLALVHRQTEVGIDGEILRIGYRNGVHALNGGLPRECGVYTLDLRTVFITRHDFDSLICEDGIHPTAKGHEIIDNRLHELLTEIA